MNTLIKKQHQPYFMLLGMLSIFTIFSFIVQTPQEILKGFVAINMTRGVLITDYMFIGGMGAALMNGVVISVITITLSIRLKIVPCGATIMALFVTFGFALFGKDLLNMLPIATGVWLYSKTKNRPYSEYYVAGLLAATISPITSEIFFIGIYSWYINIILGVVLGVMSGFLFPMVSEFIANVHLGYNLYNMGFVGGLLATFFIAVLSSVGITVTPEYYVSSGNNLSLGILMMIISMFLIFCGIIFGDRKTWLTDLIAVTKYHGTLPSDYYAMFGANIYINMGLLCAIGTCIVLLTGAQLNGPTMAGILTITGFGTFGKHFRNVMPLILGALLSTFSNQWDVTYTPNVLAILFSTGLAPIAGRYGIFWGTVVGFLHVSAIHHVGSLCNGLNLYNNGFAAGFVAILMIPIIDFITKTFKKSAKKSVDNNVMA